MIAPCALQAKDVKGAEKATRLVQCPSGCTESGGGVWGTDLYTDDSAVCPALIHAGVLKASGGSATITFTKGQLTYLGSSRNGVDSADYGKWARSFYAQALDANGLPTGPIPQLFGDDHTGRLSC
ncbi:MAG: LCCL domain-containing protein, partial [Polyangiales bacterium]